jgi:tripartite-type tricarboxylate transporter receptor subunit TctC
VRHLWLREARPRIRIIVPFAAVGTSDVFARLYGPTLQEVLGPNLKGQ